MSVRPARRRGIGALPSRAVWTMRGGDVLVAVGLLALYVEMLKATRTGTASVIEHSLSVLVFAPRRSCSWP